MSLLLGCDWTVIFFFQDQSRHRCEPVATRDGGRYAAAAHFHSELAFGTRMGGLCGNRCCFNIQAKVRVKTFLGPHKNPSNFRSLTISLSLFLLFCPCTSFFLSCSFLPLLPRLARVNLHHVFFNGKGSWLRRVNSIPL